MITKDNGLLYANLFEEAVRLLQDNKSLLNIIDAKDEDFIIQNIDDYFLNIGNINKIIQTKNSDQDLSNDADNKFLILPYDEEFFTIDANSRKILTPQKFATYGVGVSGDNIAEIIYFSIDRYFDITDLSTKEILIQWKTPNGDEGLSPVINKTLGRLPGKFVFGWPIVREMTKTPGAIQYSVRFFDRDEEQRNLEFSFATLASTIKINSGLDFDIGNKKEMEDSGIYASKNTFKLLQKIQNSVSSNVSTFPWPIEFIANRYTPAGDEVDLNADGKLELKAIAKFIGSLKDNPLIPDVDSAAQDKAYVKRSIDYEWTVNGILDDSGSKDKIPDQDYVQVLENEEYDKNEIYYSYQDGNYSVYIVSEDDIADFPPEDKQIYHKFDTYVVNRPGRYQVVGVSGSRGNNKSKFPGKVWIVPEPKEPAYNISEADLHVIVRDDNFNNCILNYQISTDDNGVITYQWKHSSLAAGPEDTGYYVPDAINSTLNATDYGYYWVEAVNNKNNAQALLDAAKIDKKIRITKPAKAFELGSNVICSYDDELSPSVKDGSIYCLNASTLNVSVNASVAGHMIDSDVIYYQWQKRNNLGDFEELIGEVGPSLNVNESGTYRCVITNIYNLDIATTTSYNFVVSK